MIFLSIFLVMIEYSLACLCVGAILFRTLVNKSGRDPSISAGTELATTYLLGQGILANAWMLLALAGWFSRIFVAATVFLLAIGGIALTCKSIFEFIQQLICLYNESKKESPGWKLIIVLTLLICAAWSTSLGRSPKVDGSGFYLAIAKVTADSHRLAPLPGFEALTNIGLQGEMHFAALMSLGSPGAARLFPWPTILAGAVMLLALSKASGLQRRGQWLVLAMLFTSSAVIESSGSGKTDLFAAGLGLAAYYWAIRVRDIHEGSAFWLSGLFAGLALVAKISYIPTFIPSIAIIVLWSYFSKTREKAPDIDAFKEMSRYLLILMTGVLIAITPYLIKNYALFEDPLAPFGAGAGALQDQSWYGPETTRRILSTIPFALTFGDHWAQMGNLTALVLAFSPLGLLLPRPRRLIDSPLFIITISAILGMTMWFILRPSVLAPRYFMACLLLLILPAARSAEFATSSEAGSRILHSTVIMVTTAIIIVTGSYYFDRVFFPKSTYSYLSGRISECETEPKYCGLFEVINSSVPHGRRLFTNTYFRYWLRSDLIQCALTTDESNAYFNLETSEQRWSFIYGRGFNFIPLFDIGNRIQNIVITDLEHVPQWLRVTRIEDGKNALLQLNSTDPSRKPGVGCGQISPPAWDIFNLPGI